MTSTNTIGFIGAGNMASSMIVGLLKSGVSTANIVVSDSDAKQCLRQQKLGIQALDTATLASQCEVVILAVKPAVVTAVCRQITEHIKTNTLVISLAAGVAIKTMAPLLPKKTAIVRVMPNTAAAISLSASALFANATTSEAQKKQTQTIMASIGSVHWLKNERLIDVATALSGSGPVYFFSLIDALSKAAIDLGMDEQTAQQLSFETALGAATLVQQASKKGVDVKQLTAQVCSPKGTTEKALNSLAQNSFDAVVAEALQQAFQRAEQISQALDSGE